MNPHKLMEVLIKQIEGMINFALIAVGAALVAFFLSSSWKNKFHYILPAILLGCITGFGVHEITGIYGLGILTAAIATITAPATIAAFEGKTAQQLIEQMRDLIGKKKE